MSKNLITCGIDIEKIVDKDIWVGSKSYLGYTVVITNATLDDIENAKFEDKLDKSYITLVEGSVYVGEKPASYDFSDGLLTVYLGTISDEVVVITFKVKKIHSNH